MRYGATDSESRSRFGGLIQAYRRQAGLTQLELATKAGLSVGALRDIEQSRRRPRSSSLAALADGLDLDPEQGARLLAAGRELPASRHHVPPPATQPADQARCGQGLWLAVLGPLEAWRDGAPLSLGPPARRAVLGMLLLEPDVLMRRETVIDVLWGEAPPRTAVGLVQAHVSRLRGVLEPCKGGTGDDGMIKAVSSAYKLSLPAEELDLLVFRDLAARAAATRAGGDDVTACELYEQAIALWRGDPLSDVDVLSGHPGVTLVRQQLTSVLLRYAEVACALGRYRRVLPRLQALAVAEPLNEPAHAWLMIALAGSGQQAEAIHVYEALRWRLDRELGLYPGEELAEAHLRVLRQDIHAGSARRAHPHRAAQAGLQVVPRQLPAASPHFTGRVVELKVLSGLLEPEPDKAEPDQTRGVVIAALTGMAGIGKTVLAVYWAHRVADRFPDGQLFVNLRGFGPTGAAVAPSEAISSLLSALGVPDALIPADMAARAALLRSRLAGRRILMVLDNAEDAEQVRSLMPGAPGCLVLVTSRNRLTGLAAAEGARLIPLDVLADWEARDLLVKKLGAARAGAELTAVRELVDLCARLPLALSDVAARAASRPRLPLSRLATEMREERGRLDALETGEPATSVRMVFSWSRARLSRLAGRMFSLQGIHPGPDITVPAAASLAGLPPGQVHVALAELCDQHLITEYVPGRYTCHALLRTYAAEAAHVRDGVTEHRAAIHRVLDHYLHTANQASAALYPHSVQLTRGRPMPGVRPEDILSPDQAAQWFENERDVLLAAIDHAASEDYAPHAWELPHAVGSFFQGEEYWRKLTAAQQSALAAADELGDLAGQVLAHYHLGVLTFRLGDDDSACQHLGEAIELAGNAGNQKIQALACFARAYVLRSRYHGFPELTRVTA
jgi:DNA-binding SARP family transcriptional activator/transcriptional regulator with XRE-family HTH domain/tetratricopeptide (TPR) repeat protein